MSLIERWSQVTKLDGRNIFFDRLYTSLSFELWLYGRNINSIGTLKLNRKDIPNEIKDTSLREPLSTAIYWQDNGPLVLSSYVVKSASGKKSVVLLSTVSPTFGTTRDDKNCKPGLYKLYDFTKGGTDILDQSMGFHTWQTKVSKMDDGSIFLFI